MAPRGFTLPPASTQSAKAARSSFYCSLCQKGYARMNEYEAHESSYDHQHKKRLKEMKEMQRQVQPKKEEKGPLLQIKLGGTAKTAGGFKKGGFKSAFAPAEGESEIRTPEVKQEPLEVKAKGDREPEVETAQEPDSDITDDEDYYDPRKPTGCLPGCRGRAVAGS